MSTASINPAEARPAAEALIALGARLNAKLVYSWLPGQRFQQATGDYVIVKQHPRDLPMSEHGHIRDSVRTLIDEPSRPILDDLLAHGLDNASVRDAVRAYMDATRAETLVVRLADGTEMHVNQEMARTYGRAPRRWLPGTKQVLLSEFPVR